MSKCLNSHIRWFIVFSFFCFIFTSFYSIFSSLIKEEVLRMKQFRIQYMCQIRFWYIKRARQFHIFIFYFYLVMVSNRNVIIHTIHIRIHNWWIFCASEKKILECISSSRQYLLFVKSLANVKKNYKFQKSKKKTSAGW